MSAVSFDKLNTQISVYSVLINNLFPVKITSLDYTIV